MTPDALTAELLDHKSEAAANKIELTQNTKTKTNTLTPELLLRMNAYWRAANYVSVGQIYLYENPLLKDPLKLSHVMLPVVGYSAGPELTTWALLRNVALEGTNTTRPRLAAEHCYWPPNGRFVAALNERLSFAS